MAFMIDEALLPATLTSAPMTDEAFAAFCGEHPDLFFEMTAEGEIIVMPPNYSVTGFQGARICRQLEAWSEQDARGVAGDASSGFVLPNGARRSPGACWISHARIAELAEEERLRYLHLCPDFVIELKSKTDRMRVLREKMREWTGNGARLAWLIDTEAKAVEIYRPGREPERVENPAVLRGEGPVEGFVLDLSRIWDPLAR